MCFSLGLGDRTVENTLALHQLLVEMTDVVADVGKLLPIRPNQERLLIRDLVLVPRSVAEKRLYSLARAGLIKRWERSSNVSQSMDALLGPEASLRFKLRPFAKGKEN